MVSHFKNVNAEKTDAVVHELCDARIFIASYFFAMELRKIRREQINDEMNFIIFFA